MVARSKDKFLVAFDEWKSRKDISLGKDEERIEYIKCDLSDIEDAKRAADQIRQRTNRLHIVICNAGLDNPPTSPSHSLPLLQFES